MNLIEFISNQREPLTELLDLLPIPIFYKDRSGAYLGCNKAFENFIKLSRDELIGKTSHELFPEKLADIYSEKDEELFNEPGIQVYDGEVVSYDNEMYIARFHKSTFTGKGGEVTGLIGAVFDITREVRQERYLEQLASYDTLTGLYNRRRGMAMVDMEISRSRHKDLSLSIIMMDVDYFKKINDIYGHIYGDEVLKRVSQIVKDNLREQDIVFRYGGEEFICCLPEAGREEALLVAEGIRESIASTFINQDGDTDRHITASFGISVFPGDGEGLGQLINRADHAMYRIKKNGRNGIGFAEKSSG